MREVKPGEYYRHFKDRLYQVIAIGRHSETNEKMVVYQAMYGDEEIWVRPYDEFVGEVDREKYPDADQEMRFQLQGPDAGRRMKAAEAFGRAAADVQAAQSVSMAPEAQPLRSESPSVTVPEPEEPGLDPLVLEFLDARTYEQRLNVLAALHHRITNEMITTMALCCDIEVEGDDVEQRYEELKQCLITKDRFEIKRLG